MANNQKRSSGAMRYAIAEAHGYTPRQVDEYIGNLLMELKSPHRVVVKINEELGTHFYRNSIENWARVRGWIKNGSWNEVEWTPAPDWKQDRNGRWQPPQLKREEEPKVIVVPVKPLSGPM